MKNNDLSIYNRNIILARYVHDLQIGYMWLIVLNIPVLVISLKTVFGRMIMPESVLAL